MSGDRAEIAPRSSRDRAEIAPIDSDAAADIATTAARKSLTLRRYYFGSTGWLDADFAYDELYDKAAQCGRPLGRVRRDI